MRNTEDFIDMPLERRYMTVSVVLVFLGILTASGLTLVILQLGLVGVGLFCAGAASAFLRR